MTLPLVHVKSPCPSVLQSHMPIVYACAHTHMHATLSQPSTPSPHQPKDNQSFSSVPVVTETPASRPCMQTCRTRQRYTHIQTHTLTITSTETFTSRQQVWICKELETNEWMDRRIRRGAGERGRERGVQNGHWAVNYFANQSSPWVPLMKAVQTFPLYFK